MPGLFSWTAKSFTMRIPANASGTSGVSPIPYERGVIIDGQLDLAATASCWEPQCLDISQLLGEESTTYHLISTTSKPMPPNSTGQEAMFATRIQSIKTDSPCASSCVIGISIHRLDHDLFPSVTMLTQISTIFCSGTSQSCQGSTLSKKYLQQQRHFHGLQRHQLQDSGQLQSMMTGIKVKRVGAAPSKEEDS